MAITANKVEIFDIVEVFPTEFGIPDRPSVPITEFMVSWSSVQAIIRDRATLDAMSDALESDDRHLDDGAWIQFALCSAHGSP
jgi:hypothetical protein